MSKQKSTCTILVKRTSFNSQEIKLRHNSLKFKQSRGLGLDSAKMGLKMSLFAGGPVLKVM
jgi:hypothetical protein